MGRGARPCPGLRTPIPLPWAAAATAVADSVFPVDVVHGMVRVVLRHGSASRHPRILAAFRLKRSIELSVRGFCPIRTVRLRESDFVNELRLQQAVPFGLAHHERAGWDEQRAIRTLFFEPHPIAPVHASQPANTRQAKTPIRDDMRGT